MLLALICSGYSLIPPPPAASGLLRTSASDEQAGLRTSAFDTQPTATDAEDAAPLATSADDQ